MHFFISFTDYLIFYSLFSKQNFFANSLREMRRLNNAKVYIKNLLVRIINVIGIWMLIRLSHSWQKHVSGITNG